MSIVMVMGIGTTAFAAETPLANLRVSVKSELFPDAYVETDILKLQDKGAYIENDNVYSRSHSRTTDRFLEEVNSNDEFREEIVTHLSNGEELVTTIIATAFVKETVNESNEVESRLLPKNEIPTALLLGHDFVGSDEDSYEKLTLRINVFTGADGTTERYVLSGNAFWTLGGTNSQIPASGDDYMGFTWGGGFDFTNEGCIITENNSNVQLDSRKAGSVPNSGIVWAIEECQDHWNYGIIFAEQTTIGATLKKTTLTGSGNTTSVMLKYIHTYEAAKGSLSIGGSSTGVTGGFTLTGVNKQWPLAVIVSGLPY